MVRIGLNEHAMRRGLIALLIGGLVLLLVVGASAFFLGDKHALETMSVEHASPHDLAEAMRDDRFYSSYRERTLVVRGTVVSDAGGMVGLQTDSSYSLICDLGAQPTNVRVGDTITVVAEGAVAERQPSGVLLRGCLIP